MCSSTPDEPGSDKTRVVPQSFKYICSWPRCALWYWHQKAMDAWGWVKPNSSVAVIVLLNQFFVLAGLCYFWGVVQVLGECEVVEVVVVGGRSGAGLTLAPCPAQPGGLHSKMSHGPQVAAGCWILQVLYTMNCFISLITCMHPFGETEFRNARCVSRGRRAGRALWRRQDPSPPLK